MAAPERALKRIVDHYLAENAPASLRDFARASGVNPSILSRVLQGKLKFTAKQAERMLGRMDLPRDLVAELKRSYFETPSAPLSKREPRGDEFFDLSLGEVAVEWIDFALMDLLTLRGEEQSVANLSRRLGVSQAKVIQSSERLERAGLIRNRGERYVKTRTRFLVKSKDRLDLIRGIHRGVAARVVEELQRTTEKDVARRFLNTYTFAGDPKRLPQARKKIERFQKELIAFLAEGNPTEVYAWGNYLFQVTR